MKASVYSRSTLPSILENQIFEARSQQFVNRLGWNLCVDAQGSEIDDYDDEAATYVCVTQGDKHMLSCRLRSISSGTMIEQCFSDAFPQASGFLGCQRKSLWELTRFCRAPDIDVDQSAQALRTMSYALDAIRDNAGATGFVAVVYPHFARFLNRIGTRYLRIDDGIIDDRKSFLICITHAVDHRLAASQMEQFMPHDSQMTQQAA